jgi:hypothetical protein
VMECAMRRSIGPGERERMNSSRPDDAAKSQTLMASFVSIPRSNLV